MVVLIWFTFLIPNIFLCVLSLLFIHLHSHPQISVSLPAFTSMLLSPLWVPNWFFISFIWFLCLWCSRSVLPVDVSFSCIPSSGGVMLTCLSWSLCFWVAVCALVFLRQFYCLFLAVLELMAVFLPLPLGCWDSGRASPHPESQCVAPTGLRLTETPGLGFLFLLLSRSVTASFSAALWSHFAWCKDFSPLV